MGPHKLSSKQQAVPAHTAQLAAALAACGVAVLATLPQLQGPELTVGAPPRTNLQTEATQPLDTPRYSRVTTTFRCQGDECEAWLYLPKGLPSGSLPPVVIMGHGMGGQKVRRVAAV
jgi:poly(3-hydroxybutyrate) depolymerase